MHIANIKIFNVTPIPLKSINIDYSETLKILYFPQNWKFLIQCVFEYKMIRQTI